jgi:nucleotide-binding universal stress UspA family protein
MAADDEQVTSVLVWFEDNREGRAALLHAYEIAGAEGEDLTVLTVATHERVVGCCRCMSGTVLWNLEMKKIAHEELTTARRMLDGADQVSYQLVVGDPAEAIAEVAQRTGPHTVVLPEHRKRLLDPPNRRDVGEKIARRGPWRVIAGSPPVRG